MVIVSARLRTTIRLIFLSAKVVGIVGHVLVTSACVLMCIDSHIGFCKIDKLYHKYLNSAHANNIRYLF